MYINIKLDRIEYSDIAEQFLPVIIKKAREAGGMFGAAAKLLDFAPTWTAVKNILDISPFSVKTEIFISIINSKKHELINAVNEMFGKELLPVEIDDLSLISSNNIVEINLRIGYIDYEAVADKLFPLALEKLRNNDGDNILVRTLGRMERVPDGLASTILSTLPQDAKDDLAVYCINRFNEKAAVLINKFAEDRGIKINVAGISVHKDDEISQNEE